MKMRKLYRFLLSVYSFAIALTSLLFLALMLNAKWAAGVPIFFSLLTYSKGMFWSVASLVLIVFVLSIAVLVYALSTGRLRKTRVKTTEIGLVEIGVDALESIALNSARAAQAGIKTAKARVFSAQGGKINVELTASLYSDIEIPAQMNKIQDRIKKDIERYTGIPVAGVFIKVSRVEAVGAKVDRT